MRILKVFKSVQVPVSKSENREHPLYSSFSDVDPKNKRNAVLSLTIVYIYICIIHCI